MGISKKGFPERLTRGRKNAINVNGTFSWLRSVLKTKDFCAFLIFIATAMRRLGTNPSFILVCC